jgi:hypothetical protein
LASDLGKCLSFVVGKRLGDLQRAAKVRLKNLEQYVHSRRNKFGI